MLYLVAGTRPEIIKLAPVFLELQARKLPCKLICLEQQKDLARPTLEALGLAKSATIIPVASVEDELLKRVALQAERIVPILRPASAVMVQGDTLTAYSAALASKMLGKPLIHLEAGIRSHCLHEPFPEELFRVSIDQIADLKLAPTTRNVENLAGSPQVVHTTGNTVSDALRLFPPLQFELRLAERYILVALLRRENWPEIPRLYEAIKQEKRLTFIVLVHPNNKLDPSDLVAPNVIPFPPLPYRHFTYLLSHAEAVFTDSGGTQEEASLLGVPALIFRRHIDRPESIEQGQAVQVLSFREAVEILLDKERLAKMRFPSKVYGDGHVAERVVDALIEHSLA